MTLVALWWEVPLPLLPGESPPGGTFRALNTRNRQRSPFIYNDPNPSWRKPRYHNLNLGRGNPPGRVTALKLLAMDILATVTMKNAAKCDT